jgi:hypothetical protein
MLTVDINLTTETEYDFLFVTDDDIKQLQGQEVLIYLILEIRKV